MEVSHNLTRNFEFADAPGRATYDGNAKSASNVIPIFFTQEIEDESLTRLHGHKRFRSIELVRIIIPGDKFSMPVRHVTEADKVKYAAAYDRFKKHLDIAIEGTPLENWNWLTRAQVETYKHMHLFTVEAIANLTDSQLQDIGLGARQLRQMAQNHLEALKTGAVPVKLQLENDKLKERADFQQEQIAQLTAQLSNLMAGKGQDVTRTFDPTLKSMKTADIVPVGVSIPADWQSLSVAELRDLAGKVSAVPVRNKTEAIDAIESYLAEVNSKKS